MLPAVPSPAMPFRSRSPRCARRCPSRRRALRSSTRLRSRRHPDCWQRSAPSAGDPDPSLGCVVSLHDVAGRALVWTGRGPVRLAAVTQTLGVSGTGGLTRREPRRGGAEPGQGLGDDVGPHTHPVARVDLHAGLDRQGGVGGLEQSRAAGIGQDVGLAGLQPRRHRGRGGGFGQRERVVALGGGVAGWKGDVGLG